MDGRSYRVVIDFDATDGPPQGRIRVDGARPDAFYGWMDLTAWLESLMRRSGASPNPTRNVGGLDTKGPG